MGLALKAGNNGCRECARSRLSTEAKAKQAAAGTTHGHTKKGVRSPEYIAWHNMRERCSRPTHRQYGDYGGRGIAVCERWLGRGGFANFLADMGPRPSPEHSLDRIDNDGPYAPWNCRWATVIEQKRNSRRAFYVETATGPRRLVELTDGAGAFYDLVRGRLGKGWSLERALAEPKRR